MMHRHTFADAVAGKKTTNDNTVLDLVHTFEQRFNVNDRLSAHQKVIAKQAHSDDVHAVIQLPSDHSIISSSKDGNIRRWSRDLVANEFLQRSERINYSKWTTAMCLIGESGGWACGTRDGRVVIDVPGKKFEHSSVFFSHLVHHAHDISCKKRNLNRINCLTGDTSNTVLFGKPTIIGQFCLDTSDVTWWQQVSTNDWVYTINPIQTSPTSRPRYLIAIGCTVSIWEEDIRPKSRTRLMHTRDVVREEYDNTQWRWGHTKNSAQMRQRPFVSSVDIISTDKVIYTTFRGQVGCFSLIHQPCNPSLLRGCHEGRAWSVTHLNENIVITGGDDGLARVWDLRVHTQVGSTDWHGGRVSNVLRLQGGDEGQFLSTSCPDNPFKPPSHRDDRKTVSIDGIHTGVGATMIIWELRKLK